jgi:hypothetical protein
MTAPKAPSCQQTNNDLDWSVRPRPDPLSELTQSTPESFFATARVVWKPVRLSAMLSTSHDSAPTFDRLAVIETLLTIL